MSETKYPLTSLRFSISWDGGTNASFSEVSGLNIETDVIEYRGGAETTLTTRKIPGLMKYSNVTMKRGVIKGDNDFFDWWKLNQEGKHEMRQVTVSLLDESGAITVQWVMESAWPVKVEGPSLNAKGSDVAVESIEFCHEGLVITNS